MTADSRTCYVTDHNARSLLAVDVEKREIVARIGFDKTPFDLTLSGDRTVGCVCLIEGDAISVDPAGAKASIGITIARRLD